MNEKQEKALLEARVALCRIESALRVAADSIGREAEALDVAALEEKPEPKRGVEEILAWWVPFLAGEKYPQTVGGVALVDELREALRLLREERERVDEAVRLLAGIDWAAVGGTGRFYCEGRVRNALERLTVERSR